ncbi:MAG TPA: hypothetical protein VKD22_17615 [Ramlibacter sp.]|nr:hypothetical protein [Ramlibacter sp.]
MSKLPLWLFVSYGGGHVKTLLPVARRVRELGIAQPLYLALTTAAPLVRASGLPVIGFADLMTAADEQARRKGEELAAALAVRSAEHRESVAYLGLSYVDLEQRVGREEAAAQYGRYGRQAFLPLGILERAIRRFQPALVVATNSPRAEQAALETARALDVRSICVVDMLGISERHLLCRPDYGDAVCVINEAVREALIRGGRPAADVVVTGNPAFDSVRDPAMVAQGAALRRAAGWDRLHVCLYASSPEPASTPGVAEAGDPDLPRLIERTLVCAVEANPALAMWVRRHPSEAAAEELLALRHPRIRVSAADMPLHACLHACDEVIVTVSTVGLEASIAGRYVTRVRGSIVDRFSPFAELRIADRELTVRELPAAYGSVMAGALAPARDRAGAPGGDATERVVAVLQSVQDGHRGA